MNRYLSSRRLAQSASSTLTRRSSPAFLPSSSIAASILVLQCQHQHQHQRRAASLFNALNPFGKGRKSKDRKNNKTADPQADALDEPAIRRKLIQQTATPKVESSIFEDEIESSKPEPGKATQPTDPSTMIQPHHFTPTMDPDPRSRERWERKMVIRMVRRNGRESRADVIARTEREMRHKSPFMATSVKKLVKVAHQISGKRLDEALLQMQYSKKKAAREVKFHLERARDKAVAVHGMGLGRHNGEAATAVPRKIQTKDGDWLQVNDPTRLYVSEAWVNRGPWRGYRLIHMGRGRVSRWMRPSTSISMVLKEDKTRVRQHDERLAKQRSHGPWVHHPNRPVTAQRQYYTW